MDTTRIAERLSEGGVFTQDQAKRLATTLADHLKDLATNCDQALLRRDLEVLRTELKAEFQAGLASFRNQLLIAQVTAFFGIILYITFRL
jgi:hypothetical protein